ncbi:MAG: hypothetical protein AAB263_17790, partial [Planctomycetota bacterium]
IIELRPQPEPVQLAAPIYAALDDGDAPLLPQVVYTKDNAPATPKLEELPLVDSLRQYGITWSFETPVRIGRFINGDWYVVGPATIRKIDPAPIYGNDVGGPSDSRSTDEELWAKDRKARNGSTLNPPSNTNTCGFDSRMVSRRYDPKLFTNLPISMRPGDSLVSTISRSAAELGKTVGHPIRVAAVLTCVADPMPPDAFRPAYCGKSATNAPVLVLARDLRRELLLNLPRPTIQAPANLNTHARMFQKPWIDLVSFNFSNPYDNMPSSGDMLVQRVGEAGLLLQCDYPALDKEHLIVGWVQAGIDLFGIAQGGFSWSAHGGHHSGRKWTILLAGALLGRSDMQMLSESVPTCHFEEDDATTFGPIAYRGESFATSWTGSRAIFLGHSPNLIHPTLEGEADHWAHWRGILDVYPPSAWPPPRMDGVDPAGDQSSAADASAPHISMDRLPMGRCATWVGQALTARLLRLEKAWNHDAFFACVDRWMTADDRLYIQALRDAKLVDVTKNPPGEFGRYGFVLGHPLVKEMWKKYRNHLPTAPDVSTTPDAETTWR